MRPRTLALFRSALVAAAVVVLALLVMGWRDCRREGGTYVRGLFGMECVK